MLATTLFTLSGLVSLSCAGYTLQDDYTSDFFSMFDFFTDDDPTNGYVNYVDQTTAPVLRTDQYRQWCYLCGSRQHQRRFRAWT